MRRNGGSGGHAGGKKQVPFDLAQGRLSPAFGRFGMTIFLEQMGGYAFRADKHQS
jgi:hypothetical protein